MESTGPGGAQVTKCFPYGTPVLSWPVQLAKSCRREPVWLRQGLFGCDGACLAATLLFYGCSAVTPWLWRRAMAFLSAAFPAEGWGPVWLRPISFFLLFRCEAGGVARSGAATAVCRGGGLPLCGLSGGLLGYDHSFIVLLLSNCDAAAVGRGGGLPLCGLSAGVAWAICVHPLSFADHTLARFLGMCVPMMVPLRTLNSLPQIFLWSICP